MSPDPTIRMMEQAQASVKLPAFGALCARVAQMIGKPETFFASSAQTKWLRAGRIALATMARHGAFLENYQFIACDERPLMKWIDERLLKNVNDGWATNPDSPASHLSRIELRKNEGQWSMTIVRQTSVAHESGKLKEVMQEMESTFEDPLGARLFTIGHEFGHAEQMRRELEFARIVIESAIDEKAQAFAANRYAIRGQDWSSCPNDKKRIKLACEWIEESCCDAIGCWLMERAGHAGAAKKALRYREAGAHRGEGLQYQTDWMLQELISQDRLPERFESMILLIKAICKTYGPALMGALERLEREEGWVRQESLQGDEPRAMESNSAAGCRPAR